MNQPTSVTLPDVVRLVMPAAHAVEILQALGNLPHKTAHPIVLNLEQQLLGQQVRPQTEATPGGKTPSLAETLAELDGVADREVREAQQGETSLIQAA